MGWAPLSPRAYSLTRRKVVRQVGLLVLVVTSPRATQPPWRTSRTYTLFRGSQSSKNPSSPVRTSARNTSLFPSSTRTLKVSFLSSPVQLEN